MTLSESETTEKEGHKIHCVHLSPIEVVVSRVGGRNDDVLVYTGQSDLKPFSILSRRGELNTFFLNSLSPQELKMFFGPHERTFTRDELEDIRKGVQFVIEYVFVRRQQALQEVSMNPDEYLWKDNWRSRTVPIHKSHLAQKFQDFEKLVQMLSGEITVEDFLRILSEKM